MNTGIIISPLTIDRYNEVMALWRQCGGIGLSDADSRASIAAYLDRKPGMSFIASVDGTLAGAVRFQPDSRVLLLGPAHRPPHEGVLHGRTGRRVPPELRVCGDQRSSVRGSGPRDSLRFAKQNEGQASTQRAKRGMMPW